MSFEISGLYVRMAAAYVAPMLAATFLLSEPQVCDRPMERPIRYRDLVRDPRFVHSWLFMFINISCGLCLIPLARQMIENGGTDYSESVIAIAVFCSGMMNFVGRVFFAWWSDRLSRRVNVLLAILFVSFGVTAFSVFPVVAGLTLFVINACYGGGFSTMPSILYEAYGVRNVSKAFGTVLTAWGVAGLVGNQVSMFVSDWLGFGYDGVMVLLAAACLLNILNVLSLSRALREPPPIGD